MYTELIRRLRRIDSMIREENTGAPTEFATKLGVSERSIYGYLRFMKSLHAPIKFCPLKNTYYYDKKGELVISFVGG